MHIKIDNRQIEISDTLAKKYENEFHEKLSLNVIKCYVLAYYHDPSKNINDFSNDEIKDAIEKCIIAEVGE